MRSALALAILGACSGTHEARPDAYVPVDARRPNPDTNADVTWIPWMPPDAPADAPPRPDAPRLLRVDETGWCAEDGRTGCTDPGTYPCGCTDEAITVCVDLASDEAHCGSCYNTVRPSARCRGGAPDPQPLVDFWGAGNVLRLEERYTDGPSWIVVDGFRRLDEDIVDAVEYMFLTRDGRLVSESGSYEAPERVVAIDAWGAGSRLAQARSGALYRFHGDTAVAEPIDHVAEAECIDDQTAIVRQEDGRVVAHGYFSPLGIGPEALEGYVEIPLAAPARALECAMVSCCVVLADDSVWCWGALAPDVSSPVPVRVEEPIDTTRGVIVGDAHSCALDDAAPGGVSCWRGTRHPFADRAPLLPTVVRASPAGLCAWFEENVEHGAIVCETSHGRDTPYSY